MNVQKLRELLPQSNLYSLQPECRYLIVIRGDHMSMETAYRLAEALERIDVKAAVLLEREGDHIRLFELMETKYEGPPDRNGL